MRAPSTPYRSAHLVPHNRRGQDDAVGLGEHAALQLSCTPGRGGRFTVRMGHELRMQIARARDERLSEATRGGERDVGARDLVALENGARLERPGVQHGRQPSVEPPGKEPAVAENADAAEPPPVGAVAAASIGDELGPDAPLLEAPIDGDLAFQHAACVPRAKRHVPREEQRKVHG